MNRDSYIDLLKYHINDFSPYDITDFSKQSLETALIDYWLSVDSAEGLDCSLIPTDLMRKALNAAESLTKITHHWPEIYPLYAPGSMMIDFRFRESKRSYLAIVLYPSGRDSFICYSSINDYSTTNEHNVISFTDFDWLLNSELISGIFTEQNDTINQGKVLAFYPEHANSILSLIDKVCAINKKRPTKIYVDDDRYNTIVFNLQIPGNNALSAAIYINEERNDVLFNTCSVFNVSSYECVGRWDNIPDDQFIELIQKGVNEFKTKYKITTH